MYEVKHEMKADNNKPINALTKEKAAETASATSTVSKVAVSSNTSQKRTELFQGTVKIDYDYQNKGLFIFGKKRANAQTVLKEGVYGVGDREFADARSQYFNEIKFSEQQNKTESYHITTRKNYNFKSGAFESDYVDKQSAKNAMTSIMLNSIPQSVQKNTLTSDMMNDKVASNIQEPEIVDNNQNEINKETEGFAVNIESKSIPIIIHPPDNIEYRDYISFIRSGRFSDHVHNSEDAVWYLDKITAKIVPDDEPEQTYQVYQIKQYEKSPIGGGFNTLVLTVNTDEKHEGFKEVYDHDVMIDNKRYCPCQDKDQENTTATASNDDESTSLSMATSESAASDTSESAAVIKATNKADKAADSSHNISNKKKVIYYNSFDLSAYDSEAKPTGISITNKPNITSDLFERDGKSAKPLLNTFWILQQDKNNTFKIIPFRWQKQYQLGMNKAEFGIVPIGTANCGFNFEPYEEKIGLTRSTVQQMSITDNNNESSLEYLNKVPSVFPTDRKYTLASVPYKSLNYGKLPSTVEIHSLTIASNTQILINYQKKWFSLCNYDKKDCIISRGNKLWGFIFGDPNATVASINALVVIQNQIHPVRNNAKQTVYDLSNDNLVEWFGTNKIQIIPNKQAARNVLKSLVVLILVSLCFLLWLSIRNKEYDELDQKVYSKLHNSPYW